MRILVLSGLIQLTFGGLVGSCQAEQVRASDPEATVRLGTNRLRHAARVNALALSPDGKFVASGGDDAWVRVWDVADGTERASLRLEDPVTDVAFSPDGAGLYCAGSRSQLRVLSVESGKELLRMNTPLKVIRRLACPNRGNRFAAAGEGNVLVWEGADQDHPRVLAGHKGLVSSLAFSPDASVLASGSSSDETVLLWTLGTPGEPLRLNGPKLGNVTALSYSPEGRALAVGSGDRAVRVWDLTRNTVAATLETPGPVTSVTYSADGALLAAGSLPSTVVIWDAATRKELRRIDTGGTHVRDVCFASEGKSLLVAGDQSAIRHWNVSDGLERFLPHEGHQGRVLALSPSPAAGRFASGGEDGRVCLWDSTRKEPHWRKEGHENPVLSVGFSSDGRTLVSAAADSLCLWDVDSGALRRRIKDPGGALMRAVVFLDRDRTLAVATTDSRIEIWEAATGRRISTVAEKEGPPTSLIAGLGQPLLAWADHLGTISIAGTDAPGEVRKMTAEQGPVRCLSFSPDLKTLSGGGEDGIIRIWNVGRRSRALERPASQGAIRSLAHSPDGRLLASLGDSTLKLWELASGKEVAALTHEDGPMTTVAFTSDGKALVTGTSRGTLLLWRLAGMFRPPSASRDSQESLLQRLEGGDARAAYQAMEELARAGDRELDSLGSLLVPAVPRGRITHLIAELGDDRPDVRSKAAAQLEWIGPVEDLQAALVRQEDLEARELLERILASQEEPLIRWPRGIAAFRSIQLLERLALPKSEEMLALLSRESGSRQGREAGKALARLKLLKSSR